MDQNKQQEYYDELITGYLNRSLTPEQEKELSRWVAANESHKKHYYEMTELWLSSYDKQHKNGRKNEAVYRRFAEQAGFRKQKYLFLREYTRIAAALLVGVFLGTTGLYLFNQSNRQDEQAMIRTIEVPLGSRSRLQLEDGTIVWLNAGSKFSCQPGFSQKNRQVILEGEGYFEVKKNEQAPFFVETNQMTVNVLGTSFDIKDYSDKMNSETTLLTGKVEIQLPNNPNSILLKPNQRIILDKETGVHEIRQVDASEYILWINEKLVCNNEKLSVILHKIKLWYGMELVCQPGTPVDQRLSLTIRKESPDEIFKLLEMIVPIRYSIKDDVIYVKPK